MFLDELLNERWSKGHLTSDQLFRTVKHYVGSKGVVTKLPKNDKNGTIKIEMFYHTFLDTFGAKGSSDKILHHLTKDMPKINNPRYVVDAKKQPTLKSTRMFDSLHQKAISNARSIVPQGWMLVGNFDMKSPFSISEDTMMTMYIKRDYTEIKPTQETYWHVTKSDNIPHIMQNGLQPSDNKRQSFDGYRNRVFLMTHYPDPEFVMQLITGSLFSTKHDPQIAVLQVTLPENIQTYDDDQASESVFVEQPIPPTNIKVIYNGPLSKIPEITGF